MAIATLVVIILGIQTYMIVQLNNRVKGLSNFENQSGSFQIQTPSQLGLRLPQIVPDIDVFKGKTWNPYEEMQHMQNEMEQLFGDSFSRFHMNTPLGNFTKMPDIDLQEKPDQYIVTVNAPGADLSSMTVKLEDKVLQLSIKTEHADDTQADDKNGDYHFRERFLGEFHRSITLPGAAADAAKIETVYRNGILTIIIPKIKS